MKQSVPASSDILARIPSTDSTVSDVVTTDAAIAVDSGEGTKTNLPPGYDTVPKLLEKIEKSKTSISGAIGNSTTATDAGAAVGSRTEKNNKPHMDMKQDMLAKATTNQEAPSKVSPVQDLETVGDGPIHPDSPKAKPAIEVKRSANAKDDAVNGEKEAGDTSQSLDIIMNFGDDDSEAVQHEAPVRKAERAGTSGKEKLARLLGKGDFQADKFDGPDVVDDSAYRKPPSAKSAAVKKGNKKWKSRGESKSSPWKPKNWVKIADEDPMVTKIKALRTELDSQVKWEAVRLQEAVRAQMVEDKKIATKEAAEMTTKHLEELARVREDAISKADQMLKDKTVELQVQADAQRDSDVARLVKAKEEELRDVLTLEYADKERAKSTEREKALVSAKAEITALNDQFESVVAQTKKASEAAKQTSLAFMLHQSVMSSRPVASQVMDAAGRTELGKLVAESVPAAAVVRGVSSIDILKEDFRGASKRGLSAAMVPGGKAGTLWGHFLGSIFSRLKIPIDRWDDKITQISGNEERIRRAERLLSDGDLSGAILVLESLNGLSADIMQDWISAAKAKIAADLAAEVILADAIITQVSLTQGTAAEKPMCC